MFNKFYNYKFYIFLIYVLFNLIFKHNYNFNIEHFERKKEEWSSICRYTSIRHGAVKALQPGISHQFLGFSWSRRRPKLTLSTVNSRVNEEVEDEEARSSYSYALCFRHLLLSSGTYLLSENLINPS